MGAWRSPVAIAAVGSVLLLAACGESVVAPSSGIAAPKHRALSVTVGTPPTVRRDLEGQFWVCKAVNNGAPLATFTFTYSATKPLGALQPDLPPGEFFDREWRVRTDLRHRSRDAGQTLHRDRDGRRHAQCQLGIHHGDGIHHRPA